MNYVVGGWELAGITQFESGVPLNIPGSNANNAPSRMEYTWSRYTTADHNLGSSTYTGLSGIVYDSGSVSPSSMTERRLDPTKLINTDTDGKKFLLGDIDPVYGGIRQPQQDQFGYVVHESLPHSWRGNVLAGPRRSSQCVQPARNAAYRDRPAQPVDLRAGESVGDVEPDAPQDAGFSTPGILTLMK